jgi:hypothetical protein
LLLFSNTCFCQSGTSHFYEEGYGRLLGREHVYFVSINTENKTDSFFKVLSKRLGKTRFVDGYAVYQCKRPHWTKEKVVIRIQQAQQTDLNKETSNTLFIYAETESKHDLLTPKSKSYRQVKSYFKALYDKMIVNAAIERFN